MATLEIRIDLNCANQTVSLLETVTCGPSMSGHVIFKITSTGLDILKPLVSFATPPSPSNVTVAAGSSPHCVIHRGSQYPSHCARATSQPLGRSLRLSLVRDQKTRPAAFNSNASHQKAT